MVSHTLCELLSSATRRIRLFYEWRHWNSSLVVVKMFVSLTTKYSKEEIHTRTSTLKETSWSISDIIWLLLSSDEHFDALHLAPITLASNQPTPQVKITKYLFNTNLIKHHFSVRRPSLTMSSNYSFFNIYHRSLTSTTNLFMNQNE